MNAEQRIAHMEKTLARLSKFIRPGMPVWYWSTPDIKYAATVDSEPTELGVGQWVVRLRDLDPEYTKMHPAKRTTVPAAACWCLEPRDDVGYYAEPQRDNVPRCSRCRWPLAESVDKGCTAASCSLREK